MSDSNVSGSKVSSNVFAIWISLFSNLILTGIKLIVGLMFKSQVLIADGVHNAGDVIASMAALGAAKVAQKPADEDHPYGHGKSELIGSALVAIIMVVAALFIAYHSFESFFHPAAAASMVAFVAAVVSLFWKLWLYIYCIRVSKQTSSKSLEATAFDHLADVYASLAAVIGIGAAIIGERNDISFLSYGDAAAGIVVAYFVLKLAYHMGKEAVDVLMEKTVSPEKLQDYERLVSSIPEVKRIDRIRAREFGQYVMIDVRVGIPGELTIQEGHDVSRKIKQTILDRHKDVEEVLIHLNPWYKEDSE
ncbi:cation diffusion facilitator family transporter [Paenibacillus sp. BK033]|uniref:cation diffusion facilitator family transporter n=1 Tax=unclassified Paenibacillus TaxID=185978 RepID=UPI00104DD657|nr:cation diffusion facilitator family transporter [Paenibacillus sp. BK033]NIK68497.1 cation diffusion facilitator family transporter [Paenibacillus sp. BK720]TCM99216.1 cation diffusion facilitator family transporter [Paenibacillus sp. BK033]